MIPVITIEDTVAKQYLDFIDVLKEAGFEGDLNADYANRITLSTDNSIYQMLPQGVLYPKNIDDLIRIATLSNQPQFSEVGLSPRGGGTGTNGQSLTDGFIVDISKHMNQVLEINAEERWVRVQGGVVKDQLNAALKPYGLFFAPELSTSNRATIGGMINTDASGQGSVLYGKTRDHVLALKSVFLDGEVWESGPVDQTELVKIQQRHDRVGEAHRLLDQIWQQKKDLIDERFPKLNRCLTGYDLAHIRDEKGLFNLNSVLCGAEGSLAFIAEAKLNCLPTPKFSALVNIKYDSFEASLRDAKALMDWGPTSIETIDSKVLNLAMGDIIWDTVADYFPQSDDEPEISGINLVEYTSDDEAGLRKAVDKLSDHLAAVSGEPGKSFGHTVVYGGEEIKKVWAMRKKAVGLLGNAKGQERPIPFVEDTAVPPENLADFIMEFRAVLDQHNLPYGMFGHVDAGVLHVRPAIDMKDERQATMIRTITDEVVKLTQKYKGLLWGEHGKGVRSEYAPEFFGELYVELQRVKGCFDPRNQLNPGKIATPLIGDAELLKIDGVPTRGEYDRQIEANTRQYYDAAMFCNGNGACYNYDPKDAMCPSWKGTRQRIHSPKGRSSLIREWTRQMSRNGIDLVSESEKVRRQGTLGFIASLPKKVLNTRAKQQGKYDFSHEVADAMAGCLACKSCVGQCPIKVNVPEFRSRFMEVYYGRYLRPAKDYMIGGLEQSVPLLAKFPGIYNRAMDNPTISRWLGEHAGMVDSPKLCTNSLKQAMDQRGIRFADLAAIKTLDAQTRADTVVIVQDAFTSFFETQLVVDVIDLLDRLGFNVLVAPFMPNGKALHVHGFLGKFADVANRNAQMLNRIAATGVPLVGVDPSMTLTYRSEYAEVVDDMPPVKLLQEWLAQHTGKLAVIGAQLEDKGFKLLSHCTERTNAAPSIKDWQHVFAALGQSLTPVAVGCCGMSGTYGHESRNVETSKHIYELSWAEVVNDPANEGKLVVSGYSCRSQVKRQDSKALPHPLQALLAVTQAGFAK
ncbi:MAG: FAD-binding oxidoreductase [Marinobacterium sp.]|nr:FAD-binding oxidoreductase [Marinobacterium sp.]